MFLVPLELEKLIDEYNIMLDKLKDEDDNKILNESFNYSLDISWISNHI